MTQQYRQAPGILYSHATKAMLKTTTLAAVSVAVMFCASAAHAQTTGDETNVTNEYRLTVFPHYPIAGSLSGFGYLGWVKNPELDYTLWYAGFPGLIYTFKPWLQGWAALLAIYTDNDTSLNGKQDTLELRPFVGAKLFLPNTLKWNIYNFTRLEFREV